MKKLKRLLLVLLIFPIFIVLYLLIALILSNIPVNTNQLTKNKTHKIYLSTNGVHLDIVVNKNDIDNIMLNRMALVDDYQYYAFGWGEENFYLNTPTWDDLTISTAFKAMFLKSSTIIHLTRYHNNQADWVSIKITDEKLRALTKYINESFVLNKQESFIFVNSTWYSQRDKFYKAKGSYSLFFTCNSWANDAFKQSGIKACVWTAFDFGLLNRHK